MTSQFSDLRASELYCPRCKSAQPVREKLLLVLPNAELHDYVCTRCGDSLGSREVKAPPPGLRPPAPRPAPRAPAGMRRTGVPARGALPPRR